MIIGIPKDSQFEEKRVALAPAGVHSLTEQGHTVFIENDAGKCSNFLNKDYENVGAKIVYSKEEVFQRSELIVKISHLTDEEAELIQEDQIILSSLHLAVGRKSILDKLIEKKATAISYELIEREDHLPVLQSMSEIAGQLAVHIGERYLCSDVKGSRGILMGGLSGVAPAAVVILGAGVVGLNAARTALGRGAQVILLDKSIPRLQRAQNILSKNITTVKANPYTIARGVKFADILICAVQVKGEKTPHLVTEEMVKGMKKGAVIVDVSIDQGGCVETSYPTTISDPIFIKHDVIHYCVPNMPAMVSRTASYGLTNASIEYILNIANNGLTNAILSDEGLAKGVCTYNGYCTNEIIAETFNLEFRRLHIFSSN